jgi:surfeit locus 1 family protein
MISFRPLPGLTIAALAGLALLIGLGQWQLYRLHWKLGLIAEAAKHSHALPVPVQSLIGKPPKAIEYTHAWAEGTFVNDQETYLFTQLDDGRIGFEVMTPMKLTGGGIMLVDRGFVPTNLRAPSTRPGTEVTGVVHVTGLVRAGQKPGLFTPRPDLDKKVWYVRNVASINKAESVGLTVPFMLALDRSGPVGKYPEGGHTRITFRNDHLQYALTWFALAVVLLWFYFSYHAKHGRLSLGRRKTPTSS